MAKSLQQYKDDLRKQWEKPAEPTVSAPYFALPSLAAKWTNIPIETFKRGRSSITLTYPHAVLTIAVGACVVAMIYSGAELWALAGRFMDGQINEAADEFVVLVVSVGLVIGGLTGIRYVKKIAPEKVALTFSKSGVEYNFWTADGNVELSASYDSFTGVRCDHTEFQTKHGTEHAYRVVLEHPDPLLSLTLLKVNGEFDDRLCNAYADAIGVPFMEGFKG